MPENTSPSLSGVAETLLATVYVRALESQRPDALLKDERAVALLAQRPDDFINVRQLKMDEDTKASIILRNREFDRHVRDFLTRFPQAVVVHIGCGLDERFERVDNGTVEWYDLDLPEVIELRRKLIGGEGERCHTLACSVFDFAWSDRVSVHRQRPFLFMAEGVFMYFKEAQVKSLVLMLRECFPGSELVFDIFSPLHTLVSNLRFWISGTKMSARFHWGLKRGKDLERWGDPSTSLRAGGIRLLDEWLLFDRPEPRMAHVHWMRHVPLLANMMGIYHYRFGNTAG